MNKAFLLTGGNIGNRMQNLLKAALMIAETCGNVLQRSSIYETEAWGFKEQPAFYNQVLLIQTTLAPEQLLQQLLQIEKDMGRVRDVKLGPRIIDIDILLYNDDIIETNHLQIPHPLMQQRRFTLLPLAEIAVHIIHPVLHKTIRQLLDECPDNSDVNKITEPHDALPLYLNGN